MCQILMYDSKKILVIFSLVNIRFEKKDLRNKQWCTCERVVSRRATRPGKFHLYPLFLSVLRIRTGFVPLPRGQNVPLNLYALSTPISVLFWVFVRTEQNQLLAITPSLFCPSSMDVEAVLHLRISSFCEQKQFS